MRITSNIHEVVANLKRQLGPERSRRSAAIIRKVVLQAHADAIALSPVDTGLYRANHAVTIGQPLSAPIQPASDKGAGGLIDDGARAAEARATMEGVQEIRGSMTIFLSNALPYAASIEDGSSQQAPAGVYAVVAERARFNLIEAIEENLKL
jgi:hypothetical protein